MSPRPPSNRLWIAAGCAVASLWLAALTLRGTPPVADEHVQLRAVGRIVDGRWPAPGELGMPPGYHWLASWPAAFFGLSLPLLRGLSLAAAIATIIFAGCAARRLHDDASVPLRIALCPITLPFLALAYTEVAALAGLALTVWLALRGAATAAAGASIATCLIRQSSLVWIALPAAWAAIERRRAGAAARVLGAAWSPRTWLTAVAATATAAILLWATGGLDRGPEGHNAARFNRGQLYVFAATIVLTQAPLWAWGLWQDREWFLRRVLSRPIVLGGLALAVGVIEQAFENPHGWNGDPGYLRNRLLIALQTSHAWRYGLAIFAVAAAIGMTRFTLRQPRRAELAAVWLLGVIYLLPHWLIDPRYYVPILMLLAVCHRLPAGLRSVHLAWSGCLSLAICVYILRNGGSGGGIW